MSSFPLNSGVSKNAKNTPYRPPHLRKRDDLNTKQPVSCDWRRLSAPDSGSSDVISSDSDFSDSDGSLRDSYCAQSSKVRIAAIVCIQDLCQTDSKSFTTQWMTLFPTSDVLKPRKFEATLMTCLLFDPHLKVQWNVCHALSNLFSNETIKLQDMDWAPSVFSILLLLLRDASNFKIRIQAAVALAVPATPIAFGRSFPDVVKGVEHTLQSLHSDRETTPANFKYKRSLENQLTSTMLHLLSLVSSCHFEALTDFLLRISSFLEEWLRGLCVTLKEEDNASGSSSRSTLGEKQKKELISRAIRSLARSLRAGQSSEMALKLQELDSNLNC